MTNPYAPPRAVVQDIADPFAGVTHADRGTRLGAAFLDSFIFMGMVYLPLLLVGFGAGAAEAQDERAGTLLLVGVGLTLAGLVAWLWLTLRYMSRNGQSIGKKMLGIKVVRADGTAVSLGRLIWLRNVVNWVVSIIPLYGIIDSLFIFGESRQCLHDKIADTIVVKV
jgi:uncharacterized RDD family membrane protein YckC